MTRPKDISFEIIKVGETLFTLKVLDFNEVHVIYEGTDYFQAFKVRNAQIAYYNSNGYM